MHMNESDRAAWNRFVAAAPAGDPTGGMDF